MHEVIKSIGKPSLNKTATSIHQYFKDLVLTNKSLIFQVHKLLISKVYKPVQRNLLGKSPGSH